MPWSFEENVASGISTLKFMVAEAALLAVGIAIMWFVMPQLQRDDAPEMPGAAHIALQSYPVIVAMFLVYVVASGFIVPRLRGRALALWIVLGVLLPVLIIIVPLAGFSMIYGQLFQGLY